MKNTFLLSLICPVLVLCQPQAEKEYFWEGITPGQSYRNLISVLQHWQCSLNDTTDPVERELGETRIMYNCRQMIWGEETRINFSFAKKDSTLLSMSIMFIPMNKQKQSPDAEKKITALWEKFTRHFGDGYTDKTVPLLGKIRNWQQGSLAISVMVTDTFGHSLSVIYKMKQ